MSGRMEHWTTQDLELYHDGELDPKRRAELGDALCRDPELRERFATVCGLDDELCAAFLNQQPARHHDRQTVGSLARPALAAACVLVAVSLAWWFSSVERASHGTPIVEGPADTDSTVRPEYRSIRVVFSLPVETNPEKSIVEQGMVRSPATPGITTANFQRFLVQLERAFITGQVEDTLSLLDAASRNQRTVAYRHLGELLRSAHTAERILDRLSPREQLAVCNLWAREPVAQPTVFERLRRFSMEPALSGDVRLIVAGLAGERGLRTWLRGYQLVGRKPTRRSVSS